MSNQGDIMIELIKCYQLVAGPTSMRIAWFHPTFFSSHASGHAESETAEQCDPKSPVD